MEKKLKHSGRLSVNAFFTIAESIVRDRLQPAYGLRSTALVELEKFKTLKKEDKVVTVKAIEDLSSLETDEEKIQAYLSILAEKAQAALDSTVSHIYDNDGASILSEDKFVRPNLSM